MNDTIKTPDAVREAAQEDREAAWPFRADCYGHRDKAGWMAGRYDHNRIIQAFAVHRLAALDSRAGDAGEGWPVKWSGPVTVGNMIANLLTLPPEMPIHSAYHLIRDGQPARLFVKHPTVSRERVDGREIKTGDESVPYSAVIWSHGRDPEIAATPAPAVDAECPSSHDGRHQVDTSMESGPNNCFYCEVPMGGKA